VVSHPEMANVFVYGSLKRGHTLYYLEPLVDLRLEVLPARVRPALLYNLGPFPGMVLKSNGGWVVGEVHSFGNVRKVLEILDEVEEYYGAGDPNNLYRRVEHEAELLNGAGRVTCWLYEYVGPLERAEVLESGIWHGMER